MSPLCQQFEEQFSLYLYGELEPAQEEALEAHCAACEPCRATLDRERTLHGAMDDAQAELPAMLLTSCRRDLAGALAAEPVPIRSWWQRAASWMAVSGWKPAMAAALLTVGFAAGRVGQRPVQPASTTAAAAPALVRVREVAADNQGRVRLVLEETRQREIDGALDDARVRQLLLSAAQDPTDAGLRFASVDLLRRQPAGEGVRRALMMALERDPNPGVRLKALEGLRPFAAHDPAVRQLLGQTLERDDNPGVRTQAIDLFVQPGQKDSIDVLQRLMQREDNTYIRSRSQRALEAMNASWETF
ncbi:MAG: HEAT repeat domain-containing protein [Bryobacterales bacterium]|nr:HEAT repeat domain-containing protein [Bryobacterales bacterium]